MYERHLLALSQLRLGPNKPGLLTFFTPLFDGVKLFNKELVYPYYSSHLYFFFSPILIFLLLFFQLGVLPYYFGFFIYGSTGLLFLCLVGLRVYTLFFSGFSSKSKYAFLGGLRSASQRISYEVCFFFFILSFFFILKGYLLIGSYYLIIVLMIFLAIYLVLSELGRAPLDFMERESELIRGYNLEYSSVLFVFLFLREYGFLLFFSIILSMLFFSSSRVPLVFIYLFFSIILFCRSCYPRYRYDLLMWSLWLVFLPFSLHCINYLSLLVFSGPSIYI